MELCEAFSTPSKHDALSHLLLYVDTSCRGWLNWHRSAQYHWMSFCSREMCYENHVAALLRKFSAHSGFSSRIERRGQPMTHECCLCLSSTEFNLPKVTKLVLQNAQKLRVWQTKSKSQIKTNKTNSYRRRMAAR